MLNRTYYLSDENSFRKILMLLYNYIHYYTNRAMIYSQPWKVLLNNRVRFFKLKNWPTFILEVNIMRYIICSDLLHHENYIHISLILQFIRYLVMSGSFGTNFIHNCVSCASIISVNNNNKGQGYK